MQTISRAIAALLLIFLIAASAGTNATTRGYVNVAGLEVYYETMGTGTPLVLLPGAGSTVEVSYGKLMPLLANSHRLIGIETQGEGHTRDRATPLSFQRDADDVAGVLARLGVAHADVLGFSNGANVALEVAIRHTQLVRRLILASGFTRREDLQPFLVHGLRNATPASMPPALREAYLATAPDPSHLPVLVTKLKARMLTFQDVPVSEIRAITAPTLLIFADHDVYRPQSFAMMYQQFAHAQLAVFPNSTHGQYFGEASTSGPYPYINASATMIQSFLQ
jgi:pimeloyl-ACP methyl ester carboxylesterase